HWSLLAAKAARRKSAGRMPGRRCCAPTALVFRLEAAAEGLTAAQRCRWPRRAVERRADGGPRPLTGSPEAPELGSPAAPPTRTARGNRRERPRTGRLTLSADSGRIQAEPHRLAGCRAAREPAEQSRGLASWPARSRTAAAPARFGRSQPGGSRDWRGRWR